MIRPVRLSCEGLSAEPRLRSKSVEGSFINIDPVLSEYVTTGSAFRYVPYNLTGLYFFVFALFPVRSHMLLHDHTSLVWGVLLTLILICGQKVGVSFGVENPAPSTVAQAQPVRCIFKSQEMSWKSFRVFFFFLLLCGFASGFFHLWPRGIIFGGNKLDKFDSLPTSHMGDMATFWQRVRLWRRSKINDSPSEFLGDLSQLPAHPTEFFGTTGFYTDAKVTYRSHTDALTNTLSSFGSSHLHAAQGNIV